MIFIRSLPCSSACVSGNQEVKRITQRSSTKLVLSDCIGCWPPSFASLSARCVCTRRTGGRASPSPKAQHICVALCCVAPPNNGRPFLLFTARHHPSDLSPPSDSPLPPSHEYRRPRPFPRFLLILLSPPPLPSVTCRRRERSIEQHSHGGG